VKDDKKTIEQVQTEIVAKLGENIRIRRFVRFELGEGLEKKSSDFAAEVAAQVAAVKAETRRDGRARRPSSYVVIAWTHPPQTAATRGSS
jgi:hypothetical protein